jgi:hypothetical protein
LNDFFPSSFSIVEPRKRLKAWLPAASATASCRSRSRPWLGSLDGEILVFVAPEEVSSDAKDVLPALKLLTRNKAVKNGVTRYICFYSLLVTMEGATIMPTIRSGIARDAFRVLTGDVRLVFGGINFSAS